VLSYLTKLSGLVGDRLANLDLVKKTTNERVAAHEARLMAPLLDFLRSRKTRGVRIMGLEEAASNKRAPTVSFIVNGKSSKVIAESFDEKEVHTLISCQMVNGNFRLACGGGCFMQIDYVRRR